MPEQILPITGLDQVGVIKDTPPVALPPNAFSDVRNVRFKDGAVRKMEGEVNILPNLFDNGALSYDGSVMKYVVWWPNPNLADNNSGYYLIIKEETTGPADAPVQMDIAYLVTPGSSGPGALVEKGRFTPDREAAWQHTFFQGGFALIINNGIDAPQYILDTDGNEDIVAVPSFATLPGWESYNINETAISDTFNAATDDPMFNIGPNVDFNSFLVDISVLTPSTNTVVSYMIEAVGDVRTVTGNADDIAYNRTSSQDTITFLNNSIATDDQITIRITSRNPVLVRAGVVRSFGDFLVAGNLVEFDSVGFDNTETRAIRRNLAGVVRTSDVAAPGQVPNNWNPFVAGVSTADEFILTATGIVQDMVELQGNLYIYANTSISVMRQTGNAQIPLSTSLVTESYGAQTTEAVVEYDGKHFVIGSQDIYLFGGHPGSIQSVADNRVRRFFFDRLNPLHNQRMFTVRYAQRDEIWICYPTTASTRGECDEALIWNYRSNIWTIRDLTSVVAGDVGPVPGGGLPTSSNTFSGDTGSNEVLQAGVREEQTIQFPSTRNIQIQTGHAGLRSNYDITVQNLPDFDSAAASFELDFGELFDTGPNYEPTAVTFQTQAINLRARLLMSSEPRADVTLDLPRYLTSDKMWVNSRIYFAGSGLVGEVGYYPGQRVIDNDASGVPTIYRVLNGFGDSTTPASFYIPNEQVPFYRNPEATALVYQDTFDIVGIPPRDLTADSIYGTVPGDGGTGNTLGAGQARWESLGPAATEQWTLADVANMFGAALTTDPTFNEFFRLINVDQTNSRITIEARGSSGEAGFPTYEGVSLEFAFPDHIAGLPTGDDNGGNFTAVTVSPSASTVTTGGAVMLEFVTRERRYVPFDVANPNATGRYESDMTAAIVDRVAVTFNGSFSGATINDDVAAIIRDAFVRDPTAFWTTTGTGSTITVTSAVSGNFDIENAMVTVPQGVAITAANFPVVVTPGSTTGTRATDGSPGALTDEKPYFLVSPPAGDVGERPPAYVFPALPSPATVADRGVLMNAIMQAATGTFQNWEVVGTVGDVVTLRTAADPSPDIPVSLQQAERPSSGTWTVTLAAPGNTINTNLLMPTPLQGASIETQEGVFSLRTTPSYLGILVSNPSVEAGVEFLVIEAGDPTSVNATTAVAKWVGQIRESIPRIALEARTNGFFLQPTNYDVLANFILDVRINDTPANAEWIYQLAVNRMNVDTGAMGIPVNTGSDTPIFINGAEGDHTFDANVIPVITDPTYLRSGGPLKIAQRLVSGANTLATLRLTAVNTLVFDLFRPWPTNEVNTNLEFPIFATVELFDDSGTFRRLNKIVGADIGWSRPMYLTAARTTTVDTTNFTETVNMGTDDFPMPYESHIERVQLPISPEFTTEQLQSIALWADGVTPEFLRGRPMYNQLDVQMTTTNYPGINPTFTANPTTATAPDTSNLFSISMDYKVDMRVHGRFMNYRITDGSTLVQPTGVTNLSHQTEWRLSGMQAEVKMGGTR